MNPQFKNRDHLRVVRVLSQQKTTTTQQKKMAKGKGGRPAGVSRPIKGAKLGRVPTWMWVWFALAGVLVVWDGLFVMNRPESLPGGKLAHFWPGYDNYIKVDKRYGDMNDGISIIQCFMNAGEVALTLVAFLYRNKDLKKTWLCILISALMTFWKTVLYMGADFVLDWHHMADVPQFDFYAYYFLPSIWWIIMPLSITSSSLERIYKGI